MKDFKDLRTEKEIERDKRDDKVYEEFHELRKQPGANNNRVYNILMKEHKIKSNSTIISILRRVEKKRNLNQTV
ncbi:hypothetical protein [uncultured Bacteroides sp.]|uniref:hypothetical protein n=1 Tax=uncultured Bacteroides sp. TaxID=162156 RepID=UPI003747E817